MYRFIIQRCNDIGFCSVVIVGNLETSLNDLREFGHNVIGYIDLSNNPRQST